MIQCLVSGRIPFAAARRGQMPKILSMIHIEYKTPLPSLLTTGLFRKKDEFLKNKNVLL